MIATSDASIKFHEIWAESVHPGDRVRRWSAGRADDATMGGSSLGASIQMNEGGSLGGSPILEDDCSVGLARSGIIR